ncbi:MAG TPA: hypothetical protein PKA36_17170 [Pseudoxanthomonas mexicana]|nr:hypothetical protein [Pseudoxanthomonas mexicana]
MTLTDLIVHVGNENVQVQQLAHALEGEQRELHKPERTRLSFITNEKLGDVLSGRRVALIVWMDRDRLRRKPWRRRDDHRRRQVFRGGARG